MRRSWSRFEAENWGYLLVKKSAPSKRLYSRRKTGLGKIGTRNSLGMSRTLWAFCVVFILQVLPKTILHKISLFAAYVLKMRIHRILIAISRLCFCMKILLCISFIALHLAESCASLFAPNLLIAGKR